jgi:hypothetical protein
MTTLGARVFNHAGDTRAFGASAAVCVKLGHLNHLTFRIGIQHHTNGVDGVFQIFGQQRQAAILTLPTGFAKLRHTNYVAFMKFHFSQLLCYTTI